MAHQRFLNLRIVFTPVFNDLQYADVDWLMVWSGGGSIIQQDM